MSDPLHDAAMIAVDLKAAAPRSFDDFVTALCAYENKCINDLLAAGSDGILGAQGRASTARAIRTKLQECTEIRANAEKRK
jgi:hypothetical protein